MELKLNKPSTTLFWISLVLAVLAATALALTSPILSPYATLVAGVVTIPVVSQYATLLAIVAYVLLAAGSLVEK
jgi:hypothetical protein